MRLKYKSGNEVELLDNVADAMVVAGKLRYATSEGKQDSIEGGSILGMFSEEPCMVVTDGDTYMNIHKAKTQDETTFLSGPSFVEKSSGEIARIRNQTV